MSQFQTAHFSRPAVDLPIEVRGSGIARVNGIAIQGRDENVSEETLRQRACTELLRQAAQDAGLLALDDYASDDGIISDAAAKAIEGYLDREIVIEPADAASCERYYQAHLASFRQGERALLRHILFAVTPGVDVAALRKRAEAILIDLRTTERDSEQFAQAARSYSNCPSAQNDGQLGWLGVEDCAPEFARTVFSAQQLGILSSLVHSRFGFHIVDIQQRDMGQQLSFDSARQAVDLALHRQSYANALKRLLDKLTDHADLSGVPL